MPTVYSNTGDKFQWNGSAYVKTIEQDHAGLTDYVKMAIMVGIGAATGQAVSALAPSLGTVGSAVVGNAITQGITTGDIIRSASSNCGYRRILMRHSINILALRYQKLLVLTLQK